VSTAAVSSTSILRPTDIAWREVAGEMVVLDLQASVIFGLNGTGGQMWQLLDGRRTLADVAADLAARYQTSADRVLADVMSFAKVLVDRGLAEPVA
jgi:hypothetical protein